MRRRPAFCVHSYLSPEGQGWAPALWKSSSVTPGSSAGSRPVRAGGGSARRTRRPGVQYRFRTRTGCGQRTGPRHPSTSRARALVSANPHRGLHRRRPRPWAGVKSGRRSVHEERIISATRRPAGDPVFTIGCAQTLKLATGVTPFNVHLVTRYNGAGDTVVLNGYRSDRPAIPTLRDLHEQRLDGQTFRLQGPLVPS